MTGDFFPLWETREMRDPPFYLYFYFWVVKEVIAINPACCPTIMQKAPVDGASHRERGPSGQQQSYVDVNLGNCSHDNHGLGQGRLRLDWKKAGRADPVLVQNLEKIK